MEIFIYLLLLFPVYIVNELLVLIGIDQDWALCISFAIYAFIIYKLLKRKNKIDIGTDEKNNDTNEIRSESDNLDYELNYKIKIYQEIESKINNCYNYDKNLFDMNKLRNDLELYVYYDKEIVSFLDKELRDKGNVQAFRLFCIVKYNLNNLDFAMRQLREPATKEAISQLQLTNSGASLFTDEFTYPQYIENLRNDLWDIAIANQILTPEKAQKIINDYEIGSKNNIMVTK